MKLDQLLRDKSTFHLKVPNEIKTLSLLQWTLLNCDVISSKYRLLVGFKPKLNLTNKREMCNRFLKMDH